MCGIWGSSWNKSRTPRLEKRYLLAAVLGHANVGRGRDSWGYFASDDRTTQRGLGAITSKARHTGKYLQYMGHTRHATVGAKTVENSHPFEIGHIIGAHNGVISNHYAANAKRDVKYEVDSMHIFHGLNEGVGLKGLAGYGAIEWVDDRENPANLYLCRLQGGSLYFARTNYGVVWSSDKGHLEDSLKLAGFNHTIQELAQNKIHYVRGGEIYVAKTSELHLGIEPFSFAHENESKKSHTGLEGDSWKGWWSELREQREKEAALKLASKGGAGPSPTSVGSGHTTQSELDLLDKAAVELSRSNSSAEFAIETVLPCDWCYEAEWHAKWCRFNGQVMAS